MRDGAVTRRATRQRPNLSQNVIVVRGAWNGAYFDVLEGFPEGDHDDDVDATSGAHAVLTGAPLTDPNPPPPEPFNDVASDYSGFTG